MPLRENELSWPWSRRALQHEWAASAYSSDTCIVKLWPNRVVSGRKLKIWFYLRLRLDRPCVQLRWLAMTCVPFGRHQICTQVKASFSLFGHPTVVNAGWVTSIYLLLANQTENSLPKNIVFLWLACTCQETCESVWPPLRKSIRKFKLRSLATLAGPFGQGYAQRQNDCPVNPFRTNCTPKKCLFNR